MYKLSTPADCKQKWIVDRPMPSMPNLRLMVYEDDEDFNKHTGFVQRYRTLPASVGLSAFAPISSSANRPWCSAVRWGCCLEASTNNRARLLISIIGLGLSKPFPTALAKPPISRAGRVCTVTRSPPGIAPKLFCKQRRCWRAISVLQMLNVYITTPWCFNSASRRCLQT